MENRARKRFYQRWGLSQGIIGHKSNAFNSLRNLKEAVMMWNMYSFL